LLIGGLAELVGFGMPCFHFYYPGLHIQYWHLGKTYYFQCDNDTENHANVPEKDACIRLSCWLIFRRNTPRICSGYHAVSPGSMVLGILPYAYFFTGKQSVLKALLSGPREWGAHGIFGQLYNIPEVGKIIEAGITLIAVDFKERFTGIPNITVVTSKQERWALNISWRKVIKILRFTDSRTLYGRAKGLWIWRKNQQKWLYSGVFEHKNARSRELWYYKPSSLSNWLKSLPKPVALMACDDNQGQHITEACRLSGIRIPEEVSVLGVDNDETTCALSDPPLSSIVLNTEKAGFEAARLMDLMIRKKSQQEKDIIVEPMQVVTRQSTIFMPPMTNTLPPHWNLFIRISSRASGSMMF